MESKYKTELVLPVFFTFAITIIYIIIFKPFLSDTGRMIIRPIIWILLLGAPYVICRSMKISIGTLGYKRRNIKADIDWHRNILNTRNYTKYYSFSLVH